MNLRVMAAVFVAGAVWSGSVLSGSAVFAAEAAAASDTAAGVLSEVVVTAQRRSESAQNVGIALSVVSGQDLAAKGITNVLGLQNAIPSLQVEPAFGSSQPQYRIRGVGFLDYTSNNASPIGVSLDEVAFALPIQTSGQLYDLDRIEVLRGPQGTLYGRNTTGGEINFITNRPTDDTHAGLTVEYGSHNLVDTEGYLSGSLLPGLTGRLSFTTAEGGAWQRDRDTGQHLGDQHKVAGRGQLEWKPADAVDVRLEFHLSRDRSEETGLHLIAPYTPYDTGLGGPTIPADTSRHVTGWHLDPAFANVTGLDAGARPGVDNVNNGVDLNARFDFGPVALTTVTAYNKMIRREYGDWDATSYYDSDEFFRSDLDVFSQEARLASTGTGPFGWVGGIFYSYQKLDEDFFSDFSDADIGLPKGTTPQIVLTQYGQKANSIGEFAQVNYRFNDALRASLGVREDHETRELVGLNTGLLVGPLSIPSFFPGGPIGNSITSNLPSGKFELDYTPQAGTLVYESISRGVKSGGFTVHNTTARAIADPFDPERLTAFEVGIKSDVTRTLRVNAAAFYYKYRDEQVLGKILDPLSGTFVGKFVNANSRLDGGDLDLEWHPLAGLSISQYAGFVEGYFTGKVLNSSGDDYDGRPLSVPKWSYGGDVSYALNLGNFTVTPEANYSFHDTYSQFYLLGSNDFTIPRYWLANANLSLAPASGAPWNVALWGRNIFNRSYDVTRNFFLPGTEVAQAGEPATFGIRVSYKY